MAVVDVGVSPGPWTPVLHTADTDPLVLEARGWLADPRSVVVDFETTSLDGFAVQMSVVATDGTVLLDTLIRPEVPIHPGAEAVHHIRADDLVFERSWRQLWPDIRRVMQPTRPIAYNAAFDEGVWRRELIRMGVSPDDPPWQDPMLAALRTWRCAMKLYAQWLGGPSGRWKKLPEGDHTAVGDARACLEVIRRVASGER